MTTVRRVAWGRVGLFYLISFGMVAVLAAVLGRLGADMRTANAQLVFQLSVAFLYMPMPLVAGLIVERIAGRRSRIRSTWAEFSRGWRRVLGFSALASGGLYLANLAVTALFGNLLGATSFGSLALTRQQVIETIAETLPTVDVGQLSASMPPVGALYALGLFSGLMAGFTINGLFAFGEEYGWRGVLMDELAPLGPVRANLLTGVMWGVWHAPLILLGFNYPDHPWLGIAMMCLWVTPLSFLLWRSREYSGSIVAPAVIHGALNGAAGYFLLLVTGRSPILSAPVGVIGALSATLVAAVAWKLTAGRTPLWSASEEPPAGEGRPASVPSVPA